MRNINKYILFIITIALLSVGVFFFKINKQNDIFKAIKDDNKAKIKEILNDKNFSINQANKYGQTPLYAACYNGNIDIVKLLLENGANIEAGLQKILKYDENILEYYETDKKIVITAKKILAIFKLTQRFDKSIKNGEKFDLTEEEKDNKELCDFKCSLSKSKRATFI